MERKSSGLSLEHVRRALEWSELDVEWAQRQMAPRPRVFRRPPAQEGDAHLGGVLLLLYPTHAAGELSFVLTKRADTLANHRGQISFPGGANEPGETLVETALREVHEELDVSLSPSDVMGELTPMYIFPSDYEVHPFVAYVPSRPDFKPDPAEVAEVLEMPLKMLLDEATKVVERWTIRGVEMDVPFYQLNGHAVWGATAIMLSEFEQRLTHTITSESQQGGGSR
jgi:8-oxo-dGTP pyrophosphatase MutT (NUDIX family)